MRVFSSVGVSVGVVVLDMSVLVTGMRVRVSRSVGRIHCALRNEAREQAFPVD